MKVLLYKGNLMATPWVISMYLVVERHKLNRVQRGKLEIYGLYRVFLHRLIGKVAMVKCISWKFMVCIGYSHGLIRATLLNSL